MIRFEINSPQIKAPSFINFIVSFSGQEFVLFIQQKFDSLQSMISAISF